MWMLRILSVGLRVFLQSLSYCSLQCPVIPDGLVTVAQGRSPGLRVKHALRPSRFPSGISQSTNRITVAGAAVVFGLPIWIGLSTFPFHPLNALRPCRGNRACSLCLSATLGVKAKSDRIRSRCGICWLRQSLRREIFVQDEGPHVRSTQYLVDKWRDYAI